MCVHVQVLSSSVCPVHSDRRDRWVTAGLQAEHSALQHCTSRLRQTAETQREKDNDTELRVEKKKKKAEDSHNKISGQRRKHKMQLKRVYLSVPGTEQIPVTANNTCIHHSLVELQSLVIYTPVCLPAYLAVWILHSSLSLSNLNRIYWDPSRKWSADLLPG